MTSLESFQSRSFRFALAIVRFYRTIRALEAVPREIAGQLLRAGTAIGANLEEAVAAHSRRDLVLKEGIALREARECRYWLRIVLADQPKLTPQIEPLLDENNQLIAVLTTSVRKLRATLALRVTGALIFVVLVVRAVLEL